MKERAVRFAAVLGVAVLAAGAAGAAEESGGVSASAQMRDAWQQGQAALAGRMSVGTRMTHFTLQDDHSSSFVGTINQLDAKQDYAPTRLFVEGWLTPYLGVELTSDRIRAETVTSEDGHSDGDFLASGPILSVLGRYPNTSRFTPYGGIGWAFWKGGFDEETWWKLGYATKSDWVALGSSLRPRNGVRRQITVDDPSGPVFMAGVDVEVKDHWSLDVMLRYIDIDMKAHYRIKQANRYEDRGSYTIPLSHTAWGLGVRYNF